MSSDDTKVIIEYFDDKFAVLIENVETVIKTRVREIIREEISAELEPINADIKVIKAAVTDTNIQVQDHERRITHLEAS